jgi:hypothetical protein
MQALRKKYARLRIKVLKISYRKKSDSDSFEYREWK